MNTNFQELADYYDTGDFSEEAKAAQPTTDDAGPGGPTEPMDSFTVRLPVSVLEAVRKIAAEGNDTTGSVIRRMVEGAVAEHTSDEATIPVRALRKLISLANDPEQGRKVS
ncbi:ribbon-helix-helix protein, CopG family [Corynebacterium gallinarum]|uniref:Ribbon-helix-helix protein, CopG family n=1 Tax=Corynebacterium gallinarum TaxID=2762214 RepID=A0A8I0LBV6_9CORY|nr:ribbon-helix-helix protein, CopG family [Corynebacterium gallinarum]MBD8031307.1 ribbon-helix-helix protein, CopG family [Corynebacterium gallinarum]